MKTEKLKSMIKRSIGMYGNRLNITDEQIDYILDLCDDNYQIELERVEEAQRRINEVFIIALGKQRFNEVNQGITSNTQKINQ